MSLFSEELAFGVRPLFTEPESRPTRPERLRFGVFDVDVPSRSLRRAGIPVRLQEKPFRLLEALLEQPGRVVDRAKLQEKLWPDAEHGEFDLGLNTAARKLRRALGDSAAQPRYIETVPRVGYRFVAPVEATLTEDPQGRRSTRNPSAVSGLPRLRPALFAVALLILSLGWMVAGQWAGRGGL